jgi:hypothetical protein
MTGKAGAAVGAERCEEGVAGGGDGASGKVGGGFTGGIETGGGLRQDGRNLNRMRGGEERCLKSVLPSSA